MFRVELSDSVTTDTLHALHAHGLDAFDAQGVVDLLKSAGGDVLSPVYRVSPAEIADDRYGFARQFQLVLRSDCDHQAVMDKLQHSPLVKSIKPVTLRRAFDNAI